eukprot:3713505-Rhodomonas_salina.1
MCGDMDGTTKWNAESTAERVGCIGDVMMTFVCRSKVPAQSPSFLGDHAVALGRYTASRPAIRCGGSCGGQGSCALLEITMGGICSSSASSAVAPPDEQVFRASSPASSPSPRSCSLSFRPQRCVPRSSLEEHVLATTTFSWQASHMRIIL